MILLLKGFGSRLQVYIITPPPPPPPDPGPHFRITFSHPTTMASNPLVQPAVTYRPTSDQSEANSEITNQELVPDTLDPTTGYKYLSLGTTSIFSTSFPHVFTKDRHCFWIVMNL